MLGAISFSKFSHLPPTAASTIVNPVMLPPGRGRPATKPEPTGSLTIANTIGMVPVSRCNAAVTAVIEQKITSGCDPISSVTKSTRAVGIPVCPPLLEPDVAAICPTQSRQFRIPGVYYPVYRLVIIFAALAVAALLYALMMRTRLGMLIRAGASNREMVGALSSISSFFTRRCSASARRSPASPA
jgi:hypothetical protein